LEIIVQNVALKIAAPFTEISVVTCKC